MFCVLQLLPKLGSRLLGQCAVRVPSMSERAQSSSAAPAPRSARSVHEELLDVDWRPQLPAPPREHAVPAVPAVPAPLWAKLPRPVTPRPRRATPLWWRDSSWDSRRRKSHSRRPGYVQASDSDLRGSDSSQRGHTNSHNVDANGDSFPKHINILTFTVTFTVKFTVTYTVPVTLPAAQLSQRAKVAMPAGDKICRSKVWL